MEDCTRNLEFVRNNIITDRAFKKIIRKYGLNNPLVNMLAYDDWKPLGTELYLIGKWIRFLHGTENLEEVCKGLLKHHDDYYHSRLQLKVGHKLSLHTMCHDLIFEPQINGINKPDIMVQIETGKVYIELTTKKGLKRVKKYLTLPEQIRTILKKNNISEPFSISVKPEKYPREKEVEEILERLSKNGYRKLPINIKIGHINIEITKSEHNSEMVISGGVDSSGTKFGAATYYKPFFEKILHDKIKQLPQSFPSVLIIDISELGSLSTEFEIYDFSDKKFLEKITPNFDGDSCNNLLGLLILKISKHEKTSEELVKIYPLANNKCKNKTNLYALESYLPAPDWWEGEECTKNCKDIFGDLKKYVSDIDTPSKITKRYSSVTCFMKSS